MHNTLDFQTKESDVCSMTKYKQKLKEWHKRYGEFSAETQSQIDKLVNEFTKAASFPNNIINKVSVMKPAEGTRFIREYNGRKHEVIALAKGFKYRNKTYNSLSAIAYEITQTKWNGKRFFGVCK